MENSKTILYNNLLEPLSNATICVLSVGKPFLFGICRCGCNKPLERIVLRFHKEFRRFKKGHSSRNRMSYLTVDEIEKRYCHICSRSAKHVENKPVKMIGRWIRYKNILKYHPESEYRDELNEEDWICFNCYMDERSKAPEYRSNVMKHYYKKVRYEGVSRKLGYCTSQKCDRQKKSVIVKTADLYKLYNRCSECKTAWPKETFRCPCCALILRTHARSNKKAKKYIE